MPKEIDSYTPSYEETGRIDAAPVEDGLRIDLQAANKNLSDIPTAHELLYQREVDIAYERKTRPSTPRDIVDITGGNVWVIKDAHKREETGETINVVQLRHPRHPVSPQDLSQAA